MSESKVIRLSSETVDFVNLYRSYLVDLYSYIFENAPEDLRNYEVQKWINASPEEIINRALYTYCHDLNLIRD